MNEPTVRPPAVSGRFFPADHDQLAEIVDRCLAEAREPRTAGTPKAITAPHAGFVFSGPIAGSAFAMLHGAADRIRRVVLIGPSHHVAFDGVALSEHATFRTPLGDVPVDRDGVERARGFDFVSEFEAAHENEHSLETHLPFLQRVLDDFEIIPLVTGRIAADELAGLLDELWGGDETLVCVSSDLSHFLDYESARTRDEETARKIAEFRSDAIGPRDACGFVALGGLSSTGARREMSCEVVDLRNSGDTSGDRSRVVGYGAFGFWE